MKIIFAGNPPYNSPLFDFKSHFASEAQREGIECIYLTDGAIKLPMTLWRMAREWDPDDEVVVIATTAQGVAGVRSAASISPFSRYKIIFIPPTTAIHDLRGLVNLGRYAGLSAVTLSPSAEFLERMHCATGSRCELLMPPALRADDSMRAGNPGNLTLLYQGEITRDSSLEEAVKAVAANPGMRLVVNGTGKGRWAMPAVKLARALGLGDRVVWNGNDLDSIVMAGDPDTILLVPEPERVDQQVVMASYMLAGAIVVARDNEISRSLITRGTDGLLVTALTQAEITRAATLPPATRHSISHAATSRAAALTAARFTASLLRLSRTC